MIIDPVPGDDFNTYNFEYISDAWIQDYQDPDAYKSSITNDLDVPLFDFHLLVKFLKVKMWQAKGLDTTAYEKDLARVYDAVTSTDKGAAILSVSSSSAAKLLSPGNVPEGNWRT